MTTPADAPRLRRLPPGALVIGALGTLREFALPLAVGAASRLRGGISTRDLLLGVAAIALVALIAWIRWRSVRWGLVGDRLVVHRGIVEKSRRELPLARIVGVQVEEPLAWRVLGLARLRVQTASGAGDDAVIDAVARREVATLVATLTAAPRTAPASRGDGASHDATLAHTEISAARGAMAGPAPDLASEVLHRATTTDLALAGLTGGALAGIGAIVALLGRFLDDLGLDRRAIGWVNDQAAPMVATVGRELLPLVIVAIAVGVLLIALPLAALVSIVRNHDLVITRERGAIVRRAGLLQRSERRSPADAVQGLRLVASPVRRLVRGAALSVATAAPVGDAASDGGANLELVPLVRGAARETLAEALLPGAATLLRAPWRRIGVARAALWRAGIAMIIALLAASIASRVVPGHRRALPWLALAPVAFLAIAHVYARRRTTRADDEGSRLLGVSWGTLTRTIALVDPATAQAVHRSAGPLQRAHGLCTLQLQLADGRDLTLADIRDAEGDALVHRIRAATSRVLVTAPTLRPHPALEPALP